MFNDKVLIRSLPGLGVDSAAVVLDYLVNNNNNLNISSDNRSQADSSISRQFFKLIYLSEDAQKFTGSKYLTEADPLLVKQYMYDNFLNNEKKLKIVTSHFQKFKYDIIFDQFTKIDIAVSKDFLIKTYLIFLYKYGMHKVERKLMHSKGQPVPFYDPDLPSDPDNALQKKLKDMFSQMSETSTIGFPMFLCTLAEDNKAEDDYRYFFETTLDRMVRHITIPHSTEIIIDSENYLFDEGMKDLDLLVQPYTDYFNGKQYREIKKYILKKVFGNHQILDKLNYNSSVEFLSFEGKIEWLLKNCVGYLEDVKRQYGFI